MQMFFTAMHDVYVLHFSSFLSIAALQLVSLDSSPRQLRTDGLCGAQLQKGLELLCSGVSREPVSLKSFLPCFFPTQQLQQQKQQPFAHVLSFLRF